MELHKIDLHGIVKPIRLLQPGEGTWLYVLLSFWAGKCIKKGYCNFFDLQVHSRVSALGLHRRHYEQVHALRAVTPQDLLPVQGGTRLEPGIATPHRRQSLYILGIPLKGLALI